MPLFVRTLMWSGSCPQPRGAHHNIQVAALVGAASTNHWQLRAWRASTERVSAPCEHDALFDRTWTLWQTSIPCIVPEHRCPELQHRTASAFSAGSPDQRGATLSEADAPSQREAHQAEQQWRCKRPDGSSSPVSCFCQRGLCCCSDWLVASRSLTQYASVRGGTARLMAQL